MQYTGIQYKDCFSGKFQKTISPIYIYFCGVKFKQRYGYERKNAAP